MKLVKNVKALSKLLLIILIIASLIVGALLSYLWVMGYYLTLGLYAPKDAALSISDVVFADQSTRYFNVTFFNPSYSKDANITKIAVKTPDEKIHNVIETNPEMPYLIRRASNIFDGKTPFNCVWDWANYTGQNIAVLAFVDEGSGPTREVTTPFVGLTITEVSFNSSISITHFNLTVQNSLNSATYVNISQIVPPTGALPTTQISPVLPFGLDKNQTQTFKCNWDWTNYQNKSITIAVYTVQGYTVYYNKTTPIPLAVEITNVVFSEPDTTHFNVTVRNGLASSTSVDINKITMTLENGTVKEINGTQISPSLPYKLDRNQTQAFKCPWDWTLYRGKSTTISIFTTQNYTVRYTEATPSPIRIIATTFDAAYTNSFNVTVHNSALYPSSVNITNIALSFENGTVNEINGTTVSPGLPYTLPVDSSMSFRCPWNWIDYQGRNVTITVRTGENYIAQFVQVTPKRVILTITGITFDSTITSIFNITVRNSALSFESANVTKVTVTFENGTVKEMPNVTPSLPRLLSPNSVVTFTCQWDWTNYRGKTITITIHAEKGYVAFSLYTTPPLQ